MKQFAASCLNNETVSTAVRRNNHLAWQMDQKDHDLDVNRQLQDILLGCGLWQWHVSPSTLSCWGGHRTERRGPDLLTGISTSTSSSVTLLKNKRHSGRSSCETTFRKPMIDSSSFPSSRANSSSKQRLRWRPNPAQTRCRIHSTRRSSWTMFFPQKSDAKMSRCLVHLSLNNLVGKLAVAMETERVPERKRCCPARRLTGRVSTS